MKRSCTHEVGYMELGKKDINFSFHDRSGDLKVILEPSNFGNKKQVNIHVHSVTVVFPLKKQKI